MSERTVYAMAKEGRLPGLVKLGGSWRVVRAKLMAWLDTHSASAEPAAPSTSSDNQQDGMDE